MIDILKKLSSTIWKNRIYQHLFFALATVFTVSLLGYYFGTFDQASHIPFLKKTADPTLYPNDPFFELRDYHYSFFWFLFLPFYKLGVLEISMFIIHLLNTYLTFWSIWRLSKTLFNNPLNSVLSVLAFIIPHLGFSGLPILEFSLVNRTFVLPFLLIAIDLYLRKKFTLSFLIIGLLYNLHVVSVNFVLAMFLVDQLLKIKQIGFPNLFTRLVVFVLSASPVLFWKFGNSSVEIGLDRQWFKIINDGILANIFSLLSLNPYIILINLGGISTLIIFFLITREDNDSITKTVKNFIWAAVIILFAQLLASVGWSLTIIIQSQIMRVGVLVTFFSYLYFCRYTSESIVKKERYAPILLFALLTSISPITLLLAWFTREKRMLNFVKSALLIILASFFFLLYLSKSLDIWKPGINIFPVKDENYEVQLWAKNNTPKDAVFITPPYLWWFYSLEWRVVSERSTVATLSDLLEAAFFPSYLRYWKPRFEDVAPGALTKFKGDAIESFILTKRAYNSLSDKNILNIARKYGASYLVSERADYPFSKLFENKKYSIYRLDFVQQRKE